MPNINKKAIIALILFCLVIFFFALGKKSFWEPDEGRYAEISREMVESADWLTPRLNYIKHFDKPPVTYWLIGSSFKLFGQNEFAGHLPLVILGLLGILITYRLGKILFNPQVGFLSSLILSTCLGYPALARVLSTDIVLTFFVLCIYLFFLQKRYLLFYLALALSFMTKGPIALLLTLLPLAVFLVFTKQPAVFKQMRPGWGLILFVTLALPWYAYQIITNPRLWYDWVFQQTVYRIVSSGKQPFYFFLPVLCGLFFPWIFFVPSAFKKYLKFQRTALDTKAQNTLLLFFWFALPFIFFACIGKKLVPYLLPLLTPLAIITARFWDEIISDTKKMLKKNFVLPLHILLAFLVIISLAMITFISLGYDQKVGVAPARLNIIFIAVDLICASVLGAYAFRLKKAKTLLLIIALSSGLFFLAVIDFLPKIEVSVGKSMKTLALRIKQDLRAEDKVVNYRCFLKSLPFYLSQRTIVVERERSIAYEETSHWQDYLLEDKDELFQLLCAQNTRVFCITYTWEFENLRQEYSRPLYLLETVGKYVLFTNKK